MCSSTMPVSRAFQHEHPAGLPDDERFEFERPRLWPHFKSGAHHRGSGRGENYTVLLASGERINVHAPVTGQLAAQGQKVTVAWPRAVERVINA